MKEQKILYVIMGASGSGKTTLLQNIVTEKKLCRAAKKYSTRDRRPDTYDANGKLICDDITHLSLAELERKCDILYEINNNKYGVNSSEIIRELSKGHNDLVLILSDVRAIKILKQKVEGAKHFLKVMYLLSRLDSVSEFTKTWQTRVEKDLQRGGKDPSKEVEKINCKISDELMDFAAKIKNDPTKLGIEQISIECDRILSLLPESESNRKRSEKIRLMFTQYVNNIGLFDYVILNTTSIDDMHRQAENIINYNRTRSMVRLAKHKYLKGPVVFIVCASPKSGKGTLMENLNIMGVSQIQITPKYADREPAPNDKRDGMIALGKEGFNKKFSRDFLRDKCWTWLFHKSGTRYAVLRDDIVQRINQGACQIFVSNFEQIHNVTNESSVELNKVLGDIKARFVYIYLHRVRTPEEIANQVGDSEAISEIDDIHEAYIENIAHIDHVIINPNYLTFSEDLHDQMMSLIELYQG